MNPYVLEQCTWPECSADAYVYKVTDGDSVLDLVKAVTFHIPNGKTPDRRMIISDAYVPNNGDEPVRLSTYLHDFYFDEPLTITGEFIIAWDATVYMTFGHFAFRNLAGSNQNLPRDYCSPGYYGVIDTKTQQKLVHHCGCTRAVPGTSSAAGNIFPDIEAENVLTDRAQLFYPILVPEGTVLALENQPALPAVTLLPNPSRNQTTIQSPLPISAVTVSDLLGRTRISLNPHHSTPATQLTLDISSLPAGIYTLQVQTPQGSSSQKLLVN